MTFARYALILLALMAPFPAASQQSGSETFYVTREGVITNIPTEGSRRFGTYDLPVKSDKEAAAEKFIAAVANEVQGIRERLRSYRGRSADYLNKEYKFKPDIQITISSQINGDSEKYTIYGKHSKLNGYYSVDRDGNVENTLE